MVIVESLSVTINEFPMTYLSGDLEVFEFILDAIISYFSLLLLVLPLVAVLGIA